MKAKILFVDDEKPLRDTLARWFKNDYDCLTAPDGEAALKIVEQNEDLALVVTDERMPSMTGSEFIRKAKAMRPELAIIMLTAYGSLDLAIEAMRNGGADDFFQKPITDMKSFCAVIAKAVDKAQLRRDLKTLEVAKPTTSNELNVDLSDFTGKSPAMNKIYALIRRIAPSSANVLIEGPSGTGKELVAKAIHRLSKRNNGPLIAVECAAFSKDLLESELFGYEGGMFTGGRAEGKAGCIESANGGTLFLDEIGEIDMPTQIALLRVLETKCIRRIGSHVEKPVDFRLIAATNRNLAQMVAEGKFRSDLFYRLNIIRLEMPALKDRPGDIALLINHFITEFAAQNDNRVTSIEPTALKRLEAYTWPGNVRELRNVIERMVILAEGNALTENDIPEEIFNNTKNIIEAPSSTETNSNPTLEDVEKKRILTALKEAGNNKSLAAERLGISRRTIHRKLKEWNEQ